MRKIDSKAYNKRLHSEILELEKMIKSINAENVNQFDANLIKTADSYIRLISQANWDSSSNFNGIEMHKIKDMLNYLKLSKKQFVVKNIVVKSDKVQYATEAKLVHNIEIESPFDGRNSFVLPRFLGYSKITEPNLYYFDPFLEGGLTSNSARATQIVRKTRSLIVIDSKIPSFEFFNSYTTWFQIFYILWR